MPEKRIRAKNWTFTLNNYTEEDELRLRQVDCLWLIYGHETAPETGTRHLQGAICFKGQRDANALNKLFKWHIEVMRGTPQDSKTYCTKEDKNYYEKGEMPKSGRKTSEDNKKKWDDAYKAAKEGRFDDIPRDMWIRYQNSFKQIYFDSKNDPSMVELNNQDLKKHFLWLWGPTGTGKSHTAYRIAKELGCDEPYLKDLNKWWNGYDYQKVTIIEEADPKGCEHLGRFFKKWADKWAFTAECKGSVIKACRPEYIIVTSNYCIDTCFPEEADSDPLHRRFTEINLLRQEQHVYWPLTQPEWEAANAQGIGVNRESGNTIPIPYDVIEMPSTQEEADSEAIEDVELPSEPDEGLIKKRRIEG